MEGPVSDRPSDDPSCSSTNQETAKVDQAARENDRKVFSSGFEVLKRRVDQQRSAYVRCSGSVQKCREKLLEFNENCAERAFHLSMLDKATTSTPKGNVSAPGLRTEFSSSCSLHDPELAIKESELSQSLRQSLTVDLLQMHRWWKKSVKDLEGREKECLNLEKSLNQLLMNKHIKYVQLWQSCQNVKRDFSAFRSEMFRLLKSIDCEMHRDIRRSAVVTQKVHLRSVSRTQERLRRVRSKGFVSSVDHTPAISSFRSPVSAEQSDGGSNATENAKIRHLTERVESLEASLKQYYVELSTMLTVLLETEKETAVVNAESVVFSSDGFSALLQTVSKAIWQIKVTQRNQEEALTEATTSVSDSKARYEACQMQLKAMEEAKNNSSANLAKAIEEQQKLQDEIEALNEELKEVRQKTAKLETTSDNERTRTVLEELRRSEEVVSMLNKQCHDLRQDLDNAEQTRDSWRTENDHLNSALTASKMEAAKWKSKYDCLDAENARKDSAMATVQRENQMLLEKLAAAEERLEQTLTLASNGEGAPSALADIVKEQQEALMLENRQLTAAKERLTKRMTDVEQQMATLKAENEQLTNALSANDKTTEKMQVEQMDSEEQRLGLTRKLQDAAMTNNELTAVIGNLRKEREETESKLLQAQNLIIDWEQRYNSSLRELSQHLNELHILRDENKTLEMVKSELDLLTARLRADLEAANMEKTQGELDKNRLHSNLVRTERQLNDATEKLEETQRRLNEIQEARDELMDKVSVVHSLLAEQNETIRALEEDKQLLKDENERVVHCLQNRTMEISRLRDEMQNTVGNYEIQYSESDKLKQGLRQMAEEKSSLISAYMMKSISVTESSQTVNALTKQKALLEQRLTETECRMDAMAERCKDLQQLLDSKEAKVNALSVRLERIRMDKEALEKQNEQLSEKTKVDQVTISSAQGRLTMLTAEKQNLADEVAKLKFNLQLSQKQLDAQQKVRRELEDKFIDIEVQLEESKDQLRNVTKTMSTNHDSEAELKRQLDLVTNKKQQMLDVCAELKCKLNAVERENVALQVRLQTEEHGKRSLTLDLDEARQKEKELLNALETMNRDRAALDRIISVSEAEKLQLLKEVQDLKNRMISREQSMADKLTDISLSHQEELRLLDSKRGEQKVHLAKLRQRIELLEKELNEERKKRELSIIRSAESWLELSGPHADGSSILPPFGVSRTLDSSSETAHNKSLLRTQQSSQNGD